MNLNIDVHRSVKTTIIAQFIKVEVILKKNIGTVPKKSPIVVRPKARPGVLFRTDTNIAKVIDIVILKSSTPMSEMNIILSPKMRNGRDSMLLPMATVRMP